MFKKVIFGSLLISSFNSLANVSLDPNFTLMQERAGLKLFEQGKYQEAFEKLSELAAWGYKDSQYVLAFLFLKGQHVEQSTLIGMGWLAMAAESGIEDWVTLFDKLYSAASRSEKLRIDKIIEVYTAKYGMQVQRVTCSKTQKPPSKKIVIACVKGDYFVHDYAIDLNEQTLSL